MQTTIFYGNGVNLLGGNGISWNKLLESISQEKRLLSISSYTLKYESIVLPLDEITHPILRDKFGRRFVTADGQILRTSENTEAFAIKGKISDLLDEITPSYYYSKLMALNADHYITTNYELFLIHEFMDKNYVIESVDDGNSALFKHFLVQKGDKKSSVWNIHGDVRNPQSIIIGYADYSKYTASVHRLLETKRGLKKSWVNLILNTNVYIIGYGLADDETDMWDILVYRARMIRHTGKQKNEIFYYLIDKGKGVRSKKVLLQRLKVSVIVIPFNDSYESAYQIIYNRVLDEMKQYNHT